MTSHWAQPSCPVLDWVMGRKLMFEKSIDEVALKWLVKQDNAVTMVYHIRKNGREMKVYSGEVENRLAAIMSAKGYAKSAKTHRNSNPSAVMEVVFYGGNSAVDVTDAVAFGWMDSALPSVMDVIHIAIDSGKMGHWQVPGVKGVRVVGFMDSSPSSFVERNFDIDVAPYTTGVVVPHVRKSDL